MSPDFGCQREPVRFEPDSGVAVVPARSKPAACPPNDHAFSGGAHAARCNAGLDGGMTASRGRHQHDKAIDQLLEIAAAQGLSVATAEFEGRPIQH